MGVASCDELLLEIRGHLNGNHIMCDFVKHTKASIYHLHVFQCLVMQNTSNVKLIVNYSTLVRLVWICMLRLV